MTFVLGLTGGIATGKSTASNFFQKQGIPVVDSDLIARQVVEPGTTGLVKIKETFGDDVLYSDGSLNRKALGRLIFGNSEKRQLLDHLLASELDYAISTEIQKWVKRAVPIVVVDVPLLFEAKYDKKVQEVMVIYIPETLQKKRLMTRDGISEKEALERMASQQSIEGKKGLADVLIDNSGSVSETEEQLTRWLEQKVSKSSANNKAERTS